MLRAPFFSISKKGVGITLLVTWFSATNLKSEVLQAREVVATSIFNPYFIQ